jgi:ferrochelatase
LEEINMEAREAFLHAGGKVFHYISCLNDSPLAIDALAAVATQHLSGWDTLTAPDVSTLAHARAEALALGAKN